MDDGVVGLHGAKNRVHVTTTTAERRGSEHDGRLPSLQTDLARLDAG